jgi:aminoglycoside phosphotransferase (APT) family kinase protein
MQDIDPVAILDHLGYPRPKRITPVFGGRDTAIFRVEWGDDVCALRVFAPRQAVTYREEIAAMRLAGDGGVPVPEIRASGVWEGRPVMLMSWCAGQTVLNAIMAQPERAEPLGVACGAMLARIHSITVPADALSRSWLDWAWFEDDTLRGRLNTVARHDRLLHLDFHPLNVLTDGSEVTAVLDWANARRGDPRADLARSVTILRLDADELAPEAEPLARRFEHGLLAGYQDTGGGTSDLPLFYAWAGHAMLHDLAGRLDTMPGKRERIEAWIRDAGRGMWDA